MHNKEEERSARQGGHGHTAVELERRRALLGLLRRGVRVWVADAAGLAGLGRLQAVPEVDGPGRGGDGEDVAGGVGGPTVS